jgi:hypothetical protein
MDIINLDQKRADVEAAAAPDYAVCPCGEAWFELRNTGDLAPQGAVCLSPGGSVTGYTGRPYCLSCGRPYLKP